MWATEHPAAYRYAWGIALAAALALAWLSLGIGIIGKDGDFANVMYLGVIAVGITGAVLARFRAAAMAHVLFATAIAQALVAAVAVAAGLGLPWSGPAEVLLLNAFLCAVSRRRAGCSGALRSMCQRSADLPYLARPRAHHSPSPTAPSSAAAATGAARMPAVR
jgi:hypothetical protein